jgi:hypothetical protein
MTRLIARNWDSTLAAAVVSSSAAFVGAQLGSALAAAVVSSSAALITHILRKPPPASIALIAEPCKMHFYRRI